MHGLIIQVRDKKRSSISTSWRQRWHISYNRGTKILLIVDNISSLSSLTALRHGNETGERARDTVFRPHAYFVFSTFTPQSNFTVQNPGCTMARYRLLNQWTRVDPGATD